MLKLSRFAHFVEENQEMTGVFNALNLGLVLVKPEIANFLKNNTICSEVKIRNNFPKAISLIEDLNKQKILISVDDSELDDYYAIQKHLTHTDIKILYLLLTDDCNLRCGYCYFEGAIPKEYHFSKMAITTAKQGIDLFVSLIKDKPSDDYQIILYGGEPFCNWSVMKWALNYISRLLNEGRLPENTPVTINTNGTLLTEEITKTLTQFPFVDIAVSIDGPKEIHDLKRKDLTGNGTFQRVHRGIEILKRNKIKFGFSCTLADHNLDDAEEIFTWLYDYYDVSSIGFNILIGTALLEMKNRKEYAERIANKIISCFLIAREKGIYEDRIMRKVNSFVDGNVYFYDCGAYGQQIVVSPDGMIGTCQAYCGTKKYFTNLTDSFDPQRHSYWTKWKMRSPLNITQCLDCIALSNCGGGCAYSADVTRGSIWALDEVFCIFSQKAIKFLIKDLIRQMHKEDKGDII